MANFSQKEMEQLRTQMYSGFVTKSVPRYEWRGAGKDGRSRRQTGYSQVTNYNAYNSGLLGRARDAVGIKNVNNADEIRRIYDYIGGYKQPAPAAPKAAPAPVAATTNPSNTTAAGKQYQSQIAALTASIKSQQQQQDAAAAAASQAAQKNYQSQLSKMQGLYASTLQSTKDQFGLQISGLQKSMVDQAAGFQQNIADQAAQFKAEQQTMMTNQERARLAGATPQLRLQEAQDMKQAGTKTFKKRIGSQFNPTAYGSLAAIKSGTLNI